MPESTMPVAPIHSVRYPLLLLVLSALAPAAQSQRDLYPIVVGTEPVYRGTIGKLGYIDGTGKIAIPPQFPVGCGNWERMPEFHEGLTAVMADDGGAGYIDQTGKFVIQPQFAWGRTGDFHQGIAGILVFTTALPPPATNQTVDAAFEWIDRSGNIMFRREYHATYPPFTYGPLVTGFIDGLLRLQDEKGQWGFVDRTSKWVIPLAYAIAGDFHEGFATVQTGGREAFIDKTGKQVIPLPGRYTDPDFFGGLVSVNSAVDHLWGIIDTKGREVVPLKYRAAWSLGEGYAAAANDDGAALFDHHGKQLTPFKFGFANWTDHAFNKGLVPASAAGERDVGFIDPSGRWVIPPQFSAVHGFSGPLARVLLKTGDFAYVNRHGKIVWSGGRMTACMTI